MCCGVLCESGIALLMSIGAWIYSVLEVDKDVWGTLLIPIMIFDFCVFCLGLRRLSLGYAWLLTSEIQTRILLLYSLLFRFATACCIILVILQVLPVSVLLIPSCLGYAGGCYLNTKAKDQYTWFRLHVWDLTVFTVCLNFFLTQEYVQLLPRKSSSLLWPVYVLCISLVGLSLLMWYILNTDAILRHDTLLRLAVSLLLHLSISFLLASLFLGKYLDERYFIRFSLPSSPGIDKLRAEVIGNVSSSSSFPLLKNLSSPLLTSRDAGAASPPPALPLIDFLHERRGDAALGGGQKLPKHSSVLGGGVVVVGRPSS